MSELSKQDPFIVMCAPNGARRTKKDHPALPISPDELAQCAAEVLEAGASIFHMHVRDENDQHTLDADSYRRAIDAVRDQVGSDLIIQITTEAVGRYSRDEQISLIQSLKPEAVSIAFREICPDDVDSEETLEFFNWMKSEKIWPQTILYNEADLQRFVKMSHDPQFEERTPFILRVIGGRDHTEAKTKQELQEAEAKSLPSLYNSTFCCFGIYEYSMVEMAAKTGGHARVGFENNIWRSDMSPVDNNAELVRNACQVAAGFGRTVAKAEDVRRMFSLN